MQDTRLQDFELSPHSLVAPLKGAGGYIYIYIYIFEARLAVRNI